MSTPPALRRRDLLKMGVFGLVGLAVLRGAARTVVGSAPPRVARDPARLRLVSPRQEAILTAAALTMVGPAAEAAYAEGLWDPAADVDALLGRLASDQARMLGIALRVLEESTWSARGFSGESAQAQQATLEAWRGSRLAFQRSVWGFLHAATTSSFSGSKAGWTLVDYPGPCRAGPTGPGRQPGQLAHFDWDEAVP